MGLDSPIHVAFLVLVLLLVLRAKRLPELSRVLRAAAHGFKESLSREKVPRPLTVQQRFPGATPLDDQATDYILVSVAEPAFKRGEHVPDARRLR